jgi:hypothetical protein
MLASIKYDEDSDHVEYSYSEHLKQLFQNPNIYAKLNLLIQKNFKSKHSLALWEFLVEYICSSGKGDYVVTNWIDIASYRKFLGIGKEEYPEFKAMNKYLIKAPIDEVNEISDVKTTVEYQKDGRKVSNIRFHITRQDTKNSIKESKGENTKTETLNIDNPLFVLLTQEYCIGEKSAKGLLQKYSDVQIKSSLDYVDDCRRSTKPPKNLAAYTMKAIENGWEKKISASEKVKITRSVKEQRYHFLCDAIFSFYKELIEYVYSQARIEVTKMSSDAQEALVAQYLQDFVKPADSNQLADMLLIKSRFLDDRHRLSTFYHTVRALQDEFRLNKRAIRDINLCDVWNDSSLVSDVIQNRKDIFESFCRTIDFDIIEYQKELTTLVNDLNSVQNEQIALFVA